MRLFLFLLGSFLVAQVSIAQNLTSIESKTFDSISQHNLPLEIRYRTWTEIRSSKFNSSREGGRLFIVIPPSNQANTSNVATHFPDYTRWIEIAEKSETILVIPEPRENSAWDSSDLGFLNALYSQCNNYRLQGASRYIAAYGDGGIPASLFAVSNTDKIAGMALIEAEFANVIESNIEKKNLPLAVQLINSFCYNSNSIIDYFKSANQTTCISTINDNHFRHYRSGSSDWNSDYSKSHFIEIVSSITDCIPTYVYDNLFNRVRRWRTIEGVGTLRPAAWAEEIEGLERISEKGTPEREAFVYIPSALRNLSITEAVPMVMIFHGVTGNGEYFIDQTDWHRTAEKYNFIVYAPSGPSAHWNVFERETDPDNYSYISNRIDEITSEGLTVGNTTYKVDGSQIYAYGFSNGSFFTSQLAMKYPEKFAAVMCWAGGSKPDEVKNNTNLPIPIWYGIGLNDHYYDRWKEASTIMVNHFVKLAGASLTDNKRIFHSVLGHSNLIATDIYHTGTVEIRSSETKDFVHGNINDFPNTIWNEFFSKYKKRNGKSLLIEL